MSNAERADVGEPKATSGSSSGQEGGFQQQLIDLIPQVRAFARTLCGDRPRAEDLAQDALARAWRARDSFQLGTNLRAWVFRIVRNQFYSDGRRAWRSTSLDPEVAETTLIASDNVERIFELDEVRRALMQLTDEQREALILVGAGGISYDEAADILKVKIGTIKSRVSRARTFLNAILEAGHIRHDGQPAERAFDTIVAQLAAHHNVHLRTDTDDSQHSRTIMPT